jgi:hypothetical protein
MKEEPAFDFIRFIKALNKEKVRYLLIGRWAVAYYGAPVVTADYDFWIHPGDRKKFLNLLSGLYEAELPAEEKQRQPFLTIYVGPDQIDCFFVRRMTNREGQELGFDQVYSRSKRIRDQRSGFSIRLPHIDDLIALKKFDPPDSLKRARNLEDIRYLLTLKKKR